MRKILALLLMAIFIATAGTACTTPEKKPTPKNTTEAKSKETPAKMQEEPTITLYIAETGEKKSMKMEEYLQGVVAAEMDTKWPLEALAAQAIIARSFTMKKISEGGVKARGTDASTDVEEFQAYDAKKINDNVKKAVERTRGEIALHKGKYIMAWFHADGGGQTASSAVEGLEFRKEPAPYIKSVKDPGSAQAPQENKAWKLEIPLNVAREAVKKTLGKDPGAIKKAAIAEKGPSGRATKLKFNDTTISAPAFRLAVDSEKMRSAMLTSLYISGGKLVITGKGFGHGVGMSQWGAKALAEQGKKAEDIVNYFYKDIEIKKMWK